MWESIDVWRSSGVASALLPVLLDMAAKATVILLLAALATRMLRRSAAAARHVIWVLAASSLVVLPVLTMVVPGWQVLPGWMNPRTVASGQIERPAEPVVSAGPVVPAASSEVPLLAPALGADQVPDDAAVRIAGAEAPADTSSRQVVNPAVWSPRLGMSAIVCLIWLAGAAGVLARMLLGVLSLWILGRTAQPVVDEVWIDALKQTRQDLGIRRNVRLLQSRRRAMPMVWGIVRPRLLVPAEACGWPAERRRVVLLHELAHVKRWDCLWQLLMQGVCAVYWFHPLAWLAQRAMQGECERACDDLVLTAGPRASDYAEHILQIASGLRADRLSGAAAIAMARPSRLEGRLLAILDATRSRRGLTRAATIAAVALVAGVVVPVAMLRAGAKEAAQSAAEPKSTDETLPELRLLALQKDSSVPNALEAWGPDGEVVRSGKDFDQIRWSTGTNGHSRPEMGSLLILFNCGNQPGSLRKVELIGPGAKTLVVPEPTMVSESPIPPSNNECRMYARIGPPLSLTSLPTTVDLKVECALGPWKTVSRNIAPNSRTYTVLGEALQIPSIGRADEGKTVVTLLHDIAKDPRSQIGVIASLKDGGTANSGSSSSSVMGNVCTTVIEFPVELAKIDHFEARRRPYRTVTYRNVSLRPGQKTQMQVVAGENVEKETAPKSELASLDDTINITASQATSPVQLPGGGTVELAGISYYPSEGQPWWRADGSPAGETFVTSATPLPSQRRASNGEQMTREFVIRTAGLPADASEPTITIRSSDSVTRRTYTLATGGSARSASGPVSGQLAAVISSVPKSLRTVYVEVGIASGPWETIGGGDVFPGANPTWGRRSKTGKGVVFAPIHEKDGKSTVTASYEAGGDPQARIVAVDVDGNEHKSDERSGTSAGDFAQMTTTFNLPKAKIKTLRLETRTYQRVKFENVALEPDRAGQEEKTGRSEEGSATSQAFEKEWFAGAAAQRAPTNQVMDSRLLELPKHVGPGDGSMLRIKRPMTEREKEELLSKISFQRGYVVIKEWGTSRRMEVFRLSLILPDEAIGMAPLEYGKQVPLGLKMGPDESSPVLEIPSVEFGRKDDIVTCTTEVLCRSSTKAGWEVAFESLDAGGRVLANNRMVLFAGERQETEPPLRSEALMASLPVPEGAEPAGFRVFVRPAGERAILESSGQAGGRWGSQSQPAKVRPNVGMIGAPTDVIPAGAVMLSHVAESSDGKRSLGGTGQAVLFDRPAGAGQVVAVQLYASRYGTLEPPKEDFHIYLLDENRKVLVDVPVPYAAVPRGQMQWYTFRVPPTAVPEQFYVATSFNAEQTKGIYLGLDLKQEESHSFIGLPEDGYGPMEETEPYDWMIRAYLVPKGGAQDK